MKRFHASIGIFFCHTAIALGGDFTTIEDFKSHFAKLIDKPLSVRIEETRVYRTPPPTPFPASSLPPFTPASMTVLDEFCLKYQNRERFTFFHNVHSASYAKNCWSPSPTTVYYENKSYRIISPEQDVRSNSRLDAGIYYSELMPMTCDTFLFFSGLSGANPTGATCVSDGNRRTLTFSEANTTGGTVEIEYRLEGGQLYFETFKRLTRKKRLDSQVRALAHQLIDERPFCTKWEHF